MDSKPTPEIDALALRIERLIEQNEEVLEEYEEVTPFSPSQTQDVDAQELFS